MQMERWAKIERLTDYEFSNLGRIRRRNKTYPKVKEFSYLKSCVNSGNGYMQAKIRGKNYYTHRLVLEAFRGPCPPGREGEHKNQIRIDNALQNLWWATRSENMKNRTMTPKWRAAILKNLVKARCVRATKHQFRKVLKELKWTVSTSRDTREICLEA